MKMRKKVIAASLTLLALANAASAQSSVTVFGIVDVGISRYNLKSDNVGAVTPARPPSTSLKQTAMTSGNWVPSRWGFRGTEDLGGGYSAGFWIEQSLNVDDGGQPLYARRTTVSLAGPFGEFRLGRDLSPTFWADTVTDPFLNSGVGANLIGMVNARLAIFTALPGGGLLAGPNGGPANYIFVNNMVSYFTPNSLGGFYGHLAMNFPENVKNTAVPDTPSKRGQFYGGRVGYANKALDVAVSYAVSTALDAAPPYAVPITDTKISTTNLTTTYDLGFVKLAGELSRATNDSRFALPGAAAQSSADYDGAMLGATVPIGAARLKGSYGYVKYRTDAPGLSPNQQDTVAKKLSLGMTYHLSKRTLLYATGSYIRIDEGQNNANVMGVPPQPTGAFSAATGYAPRSATGYELGVAHTF
ncbi:porin [Variovorax dokdonensis]|uniref:Porin n=1 Tax=Variovorax dokdonensis TaxID=344883 RepID=A0ABT7N8X2_9BURK|nr:porin [Variovorax dokdonensis]MDM0044402.1 porin [Variovorax dokdonensis]